MVHKLIAIQLQTVFRSFSKSQTDHTDWISKETLNSIRSIVHDLGWWFINKIFIHQRLCSILLGCWNAKMEIRVRSEHPRVRA